jgi:HTH-type transcriptional regulator / antitoxin HipB
MLPLYSLGEHIAEKRKTLGLTQRDLAKKAKVGLSTLDALENGRLGELGFSKITNILTALGLELTLREAGSDRPTLEQLMEEERNDQGLGRRS